MLRPFSIFALLALASSAAFARVDRVVVLKVDGLPPFLLQEYLRAQPDRRPRLQNIATVFEKGGITLDNFYSRGLSLSAPSWGILDTGYDLTIHGNVEYDRYTLRSWDYLNFFPFYLGYALKKQVDMPGVTWLEQQGAPLLIDHFPYEDRYQSSQLLQRGIRWETFPATLKDKFSRRPKEIFDEWQTGFSMSDSLFKATETELINALRNVNIRYLDYFSPQYDHLAHLTPDRVSQLTTLDELDALVGRIWAAIGRSPLASTTAFIMVSDHGMNTDPRIISQGFNLVDWFGGVQGGGHHVITPRHPLTEFKLRGLNPFVDQVITPARTSVYLSGQQADYPTVILDLDGNERANIALRENSLNLVHILLDQILNRVLPGRIRAAAIDALLTEIARQRPLRVQEVERLQKFIETRQMEIETEQKLASAIPKKKKWTPRERAQGLDKDALRRLDRIERWVAEGRADTEYGNTISRLLALRAADFDPGKFKISEVIPRKSFGELNSVYDLQNYITGPAPGGLTLNAAGELDFERSFRRIDYLAALEGLAVRNNVQEGVSSRPVDFVAMTLDPAKLAPLLNETFTGAIWLRASESSQVLVLARWDAGQTLSLRYMPISHLRQDRDGRITLQPSELHDGLPLALMEDPALNTGTTGRNAWLSEWHTEREWLEAVHKTRYSNGIISLAAQLLDPPSVTGDNLYRRNRMRTDLLVLANNHWNYNVRGFNPGGNHGSFLRISTQSVLMLAGGSDSGLPRGVHVATPYDSLSFAPTILKLLDMPTEKLPGTPIQELLERDSR